MTERSAAGEVLQGNARRPPRDQVLQARGLLGRQGVSAHGSCLNRAPPGAPHVRGEEFGIHLRIVHARGAQARGGAPEGITERHGIGGHRRHGDPSLRLAGAGTRGRHTRSGACTLL